VARKLGSESESETEREPWDMGLKLLFDEAGADIVHWLCATATFITLVSTDLRGRKISADILCEVRLSEQKAYLHIEFQKRRDAKMAERLWHYNVRATIKYQCPVLTYVIYLTPDGSVPDEVFYIKAPDGRPIHRFAFTPIKLWEISTADLIEEGNAGRVGMLPLLPLTRQGKTREVVEQTVRFLAPEGQEPKRELLALSRLFASLSLGEEDQNWLTRRFEMLEDILKDTQAYKELTRRGFIEGELKGLREGELKGLREGIRASIIKYVQTRFPDPALAEVTRARIAKIDDAEQLQRLFTRIILLPTADEVRRAFEEQS
jgi:predicted transposase YdaD